MTETTHPYLCRFDGEDMPCDVPSLSFRIIVGEQHLKTSAWIDSGAQMSLFDAEIADALDIELEGLPTMRITGVGPGECYAHCKKVMVEIEGHEAFECEVGFVSNLPVPALLGQKDFFDKFDILFKKREGVFILQKP